MISEHYFQTKGRSRRSAGYLLFEVAVGIAVAAILVGAFYQIAGSVAENRRITQTEQGFATLAEALYNYRMNTRRWPGSLADLSAYAPVLATGGRNGFGQPYSIVTPANPADPVAPIRIRTTLPSEDIAQSVVREFPNTGTRTGGTVEVTVPIPGHEPARNALLARDGSRGMDGNLDMDSHDLEDAGVITANTLSATSSINVGGTAMNESGVRLVNQIASLNCTGSQRVNITGGRASCATAPTTTSSGSGGYRRSGGCSGRSRTCYGPNRLECSTYASASKGVTCSCSCVNQK